MQQATNSSADALGFLYRRAVDVKYCEAKYGGIFYGMIDETPGEHFPEIGSLVTTPFIMFCGLHMIFAWRHESAMLHVLSSLFVVNGVSAFLAHYTGLTSWHNVDSKSMLIAVWLSCGFLLYELLDNTHRVLCEAGARSEWLRQILGPLAIMGSMLVYWWIAESNATVGDQELGDDIGAVATAAPLLVCVLVGMVHVHLGWGMTDWVSLQSYRIARNRFRLGILLGSAGGISWTLTENMCDRDDAVGRAFRWYPGHAIWHVAMAYGMTMALLFACVLRADTYKTRVHIINKGGYGYFMLMPSVRYENVPVRPLDAERQASREKFMAALTDFYTRRIPSFLRRAEFIQSDRQGATPKRGGTQIQTV